MSKKKDIAIEVKAPSNQYEYLDAWERLDTYQDQQMTLQFINNMLTSIDSITSSSTLSVKLPRTVNNERIFDLATRPQYNSNMTHRKIECRVYINGIDMMKEAYCYLLDSEGDSYEVDIVFGLLQYYKDWVDADKSIRDLTDLGESIPWNWRAAFWEITVPAGSAHVIQDYPPIWYGSDANIGTYTPQNGIGKLMYYGIYTPGFDRNDTLVDYANVHPFVTMREIWERIISENNLSFVLPMSVKRDMENLAIVLTTVDGNAAQGSPNSDNNTATGSPDTVRLSAAVSFGWNIICTTLGDCFQNGNAYNSTKGKILYKGDANAVDLKISMLLQDSSSFPYNGENHSASYILNAEGHMEYLDLCVYIYAIQRTVKLTPTHTGMGIMWEGIINVPCIGASEGDAVADIWIDNDLRICYYCEGAFDTYWMLGRDAWDALFQWSECAVGVIYYTGSMIYPHPNYRCFPNLPDITQLEFVKMVCQLYGLFPVALPHSSYTITFESFDIFEENIINAVDWSDKLLEDHRDVPKKISFRAGDFARKNIIQYTEDKQDSVTDDIRTGTIAVNDDTLDPKNELVTFPLAASDGDNINQYIIHTESDTSTQAAPMTYEAELLERVHRLMRVTEWFDYDLKKVTRLNFTNLSVPYIISTYYAKYQSMLLKPKVITEHIRLNELEMRYVDFSIPVYLRKYGRYYAVKQIQWTVGDDYAEVELLQI